MKLVKVITVAYAHADDDRDLRKEIVEKLQEMDTPAWIVMPVSDSVTEEQVKAENPTIVQYLKSIESEG